MFTVNRQIAKLAFAMFLGATLAGCATGNQALRGENQTTVSQKIHTGVTTKDEVKTMYGDPSEVKFTDSGNEVWTYRRTENNSAILSFIPWVNMTGAGTSQAKATSLVIMFNKAGRVSNFTTTTSHVGSTL